MKGQALPPPLPFTVLRGHSSPVYDLSFRKVSILSGSTDGLLILWDTELRRSLLQLNAHSESVTSCSLVGDSTAISSGREGTLRVWDLTAASCSHTFVTGSSHFCNTTLISSDDDSGLILASSNHNDKILLWDSRCSDNIGIVDSDSMLPDRASYPHQSSKSTAGMLTHLASQNESFPHLIFAGFEDGSLKVADIRTMRYFTTNQATTSPVLTIALAPPSSPQDVLSGGGGPTLIHHRLQQTSQCEREVNCPSCPSLTMQHSFELPEKGTSHISFRNDGRIFASCHWDGSVRLFQTKRYKPLAILDFHKDSVSRVVFNHRTTSPWYFATTGKDCSIALWDLFRSSYKCSSENDK